MLILLFSALVVSVFAHTIYYGLIQRYDANLIAPLTLMSPLMAIGLGVWLTGDHFDTRKAIGTAVALAGVLIIAIRQKVLDREGRLPALARLARCSSASLQALLACRRRADIHGVAAPDEAVAADGGDPEARKHRVAHHRKERRAQRKRPAERPAKRGFRAVPGADGGERRRERGRPRR